MTAIKVIDYEDAEGRLKEIYNDLIQRRGQLAEVHKVQSLRPESIVKHMDLYLEIMFSKSELSRAEREMMAVITSVSNHCHYCQIHHSEALLHYWKDADKVIRLRSNYKEISLTEKELLLCEFAESLTKNPHSFKNPEHIEKLKNQGFSDNAILDATLVVAYFNFVNRIVLSLGVGLEEDEAKGYNY